MSPCAPLLSADVTPCFLSLCVPFPPPPAGHVIAGSTPTAEAAPEAAPPAIGGRRTEVGGGQGLEAIPVIEGESPDPIPRAGPGSICTYCVAMCLYSALCGTS